MVGGPMDGQWVAIPHGQTIFKVLTPLSPYTHPEKTSIEHMYLRSKEPRADDTYRLVYVPPKPETA